MTGSGTESLRHMTVAMYRSYGSPDELIVERVPLPAVSADNVLVRVHTSTVNRTDCGFLRGRPLIVRLFSGLLQPKAKILGCEFAGEIVETGSEVTGLAVGDRVFGFKDDDFGFGGHAEFTLMPTAGMIERIPEHMDFDDAAPALEGAHYALHYIRAAQITAGQSVLINGATGAIGSAAVQLIKHLGARVTAVCATAHVDLVKGLGADDVIDYRHHEFTRDARRFDVVFDAVGLSSFGKCRDLLTENGRYMSTELGRLCQNPLLALLTGRSRGRRVLFPLPKNRPEDAAYLANLMKEKAFRPVIDRAFPLADIADAFRYVETGMKTGSVLIRVSD